MKGVVAKMPENEIDQIKNQFINKLSPMKIYLFGSFANGTANEDSDFDFYIVVKDGTENLMDLTVEAYKSIRSIRNRAVDIVIGTESRFETRKHKLSLENEVMREGILLYG
ncbi:MAG: nucleotidyltransferase domain-containing protein [Selenomonadaceae bacterium]|nr:nucleotidyltransferase domain-containing protein [Selenomonadaceae bacterium]